MQQGVGAGAEHTCEAGTDKSAAEALQKRIPSIRNLEPENRVGDFMQDVAKQRGQVNAEHTTDADVVGTSDACPLKAKSCLPRQRQRG